MKTLHRTNAINFSELAVDDSSYSDGETSDDLINDKIEENKNHNAKNDFIVPQASFNLSILQHLQAIDAKVSDRSTVSFLRSFDDEDYYLDKINNNKQSTAKMSNSKIKIINCVIIDIAHASHYRKIHSDYLKDNSNFIAWNVQNVSSHEFPLVIHNRYKQCYNSFKRQIRFVHYASPSVDKLNSLANARKDNQAGRILFHYVGYGFPDPEDGYLYACNNNSLVRYKVKKIFENISPNSFFILDCNKAGCLVSEMLKHSKKMASSKNISSFQSHQSGPRSNSSSKLYDISKTKSIPNHVKYYESENMASIDWYCLAATSVKETIPKNPKLPRDFLTSCLLSPVQTSILCHIIQYFNITIDNPFEYIINIFHTFDYLEDELHAIIDAIASDFLSPKLFLQIFRNSDIIITKFFYNFLLAQYLLDPYNVHPVSYPMLPEQICLHKLWEEWSATLDIVITSTLTPIPSFSNSLFSRVSDIFQTFLQSAQSNLFPNSNSDSCVSKANEAHHSPLKTHNRSVRKLNSPKMNQSLLTLLCHYVKSENSGICILQLAEYASQSHLNRTNIARSIIFPDLMKKILKYNFQTSFPFNSNIIQQNECNLNFNFHNTALDRSSSTFQCTKEEFHSLCFLIVSLIQEDMNFVTDIRTDSDFTNLTNFLFNEEEEQSTRSLVAAILSSFVLHIKSLQNKCSSHDFLIKLKNSIPTFTPQLLLWTLILLKRTFDVSSAEEAIFIKDSIHMQIAACIFHNSHECRAATVAALSCFMQPGENSSINLQLFLLSLLTFIDASYLVRYQFLLFVIRFLTTQSYIPQENSQHQPLMYQTLTLFNETMNKQYGSITYGHVIDSLLNGPITNSSPTSSPIHSNTVNNSSNNSSFYQYNNSTNETNSNDKMNSGNKTNKFNISIDFEGYAKIVDSICHREDAKPYVYSIALFMLDYFSKDPHPSIRNTAVKTRAILSSQIHFGSLNGKPVFVSTSSTPSPPNTASSISPPDKGNYGSLSISPPFGSPLSSLTLTSNRPSPTFPQSNISSQLKDESDSSCDGNTCAVFDSDSNALFNVAFKQIASSGQWKPGITNVDIGSHRIRRSSNTGSLDIPGIKLQLNARTNISNHFIGIKKVKARSPQLTPSNSSMQMASSVLSLKSLKQQAAAANQKYQEQLKLAKQNNPQLSIPHPTTPSNTDSATIIVHDKESQNIALGTRANYVMIYDDLLNVQSKIKSESSISDILFINSNNIFSDEYSLCAIASSDGCLKLWDHRHKEPCATWRCDLSVENSPLYVVQNGERLITARGNNGICVWDINSLRLINEISSSKESLPHQNRYATAMLSHPSDSNISVVGYSNGQINAIDFRISPPNSNIIVSFTLNEKIVNLGLNRNGGDSVYAATSNGSIIIWNYAMNSIKSSDVNINYGITNFSSHPLLPLLAYTNMNEEPNIVGVRGQVYSKLRHVSPGSVLAFHPVLPRITFGSPNGEVLTYNIVVS